MKKQRDSQKIAVHIAADDTFIFYSSPEVKINYLPMTDNFNRLYIDHGRLSKKSKAKLDEEKTENIAKGKLQ